MKQILGLKDFSSFFEMEQLRASEASTLEYQIDVHDCGIAKQSIYAT